MSPAVLTHKGHKDSASSRQDHHLDTGERGGPEMPRRQLTLQPAKSIVQFQVNMAALAQVPGDDWPIAPVVCYCACVQLSVCTTHTHTQIFTLISYTF